MPYLDCLDTTSVGGAYSYGLRIMPIYRENTSARSRTSVATTSEYTVWRRWEDCLWFQDMLELQYEIRSREKRQRLAAGKGVKKNGMYIHDRAASFESLPPGPDPKSVAKNVHDYLPKLSKKGTLFRPSQSTIDQRHKEFSALINAFFKDDVPALVRELRDDRVLRDFFGYWRRDNDLLTKKSGSSRASIGGSNAFSLYFSPSNVSLSLPDTLPDIASTHSSSGSSRSSGIHPSPLATRSPKRNSAGSSSSMSLSDSEGGSRHRVRNPNSAPPRVHEFEQTNSDGGPLSDDEIQVVPRKSTTSSGSSLVPTSSASLPRSARASHHTSPRSSKTYHHSSKNNHSAYNMEEDFPLFLSSSTREPNRPPQAPRSPPQPQSLSRGGLESLPEDSELESAPASEPVAGVESPSSPPHSPRARVHSAASAVGYRNGVVFQDVNPSGEGEPLNQDRDPSMTAEPGHHRRRSSAATADPNSSRPSSIALSNLSMQDGQSSYSHMTSPGLSPHSSRPLSAGSSAESCDMDIPYMELPLAQPPTPFSMDQQFPLSAVNARFNRSSVDSDILGGMSLSRDRRSISPQPFHRPSHSTPGAGAPSSFTNGGLGAVGTNLRRSLSGGSTKRRPRSHSQPMPMSMSFSVPEEETYAGDDDLMDAYIQPSSGTESNDEHLATSASTPHIETHPPEEQERVLPRNDSISAAEDSWRVSQDVPEAEFGGDGLDDFEFDDGMGLELGVGDFDQFPSPPDRSSASFRFSTLSLAPSLAPVSYSSSSHTVDAMNTGNGSLVPPSPTFINVSQWPEDGGILIVKAALDDAIVSFRTSRSTPFTEIHQRLYEKFAKQEGLSLSESFKVAYLPPVVSGGPSALGDADNNTKERKRRGSTMSTVSSVASADNSRLVPVGTQEEWEKAVEVCGQKVVLRVL